MARVSRTVLELRALEPHEAGRVLEERRFRTAKALDAYLLRCEDVLSLCPTDGLVMARLAPELAEKIEDQASPDLKVRALAVLGNAFRATGELRSSERTFREGLELGASAIPRAQLLFRLAILYIDHRRFGKALEQAREAIDILYRHKHPDVVAAIVVLGQVHYDGALAGEEGFSLAESVESFRQALKLCNPRKAPRVHYAAVHNLGLALLERSLTAEDFRPVFKVVEQARKLLRRHRIRRRSVPDAKLRWVLALAMIRLGSTERAERVLATAREDLLALGAANEVARISLDLGELYFAAERWYALERIARDVVSLSDAYSAETAAALLLWHRAAKDRNLNEVVLSQVYRTVCGIDRRQAPVPEPEPNEPIGF